MILATAPDKGQTSLFAIDAASGRRMRWLSGTVAGFAAVQDGVVFERHTLKSPTEIYLIRPASGKSDHLVQHGQGRRRPDGDFEQFTFKG